MLQRSCLIGLFCVSLAPLVYGDPAYGDFKVVGTGADSGISFEFLGGGPPLTPGLQTTFSFVNCTVPAGETCSTGTAQVNYSPGGGVIRLSTTGVNGQTRTWNFAPLLRTGVYLSAGGVGVEPGYVILSGADATAGQPQSNAINSSFQFPLEVTVNNSSPIYQSGVTVTFVAPGSGPSASLPDSGLAVTDSTGRARIIPTANGLPGAYQITALATVGATTFETSFVAANVNTADAVDPCLVTTANDDFSPGSLRYQAAACGKGGTITFAPGITAVNVTAGQDIPLTQDLTIDGGTGVTINGSNVSRIFFITGGTVTLKNLMLQNGTARGGDGGAGAVGGGGGAAGMGGAIFVNAGALVIDNVVFTNNQALGGNGGPVLTGFFSGGGGGTGQPGGSSVAGINGNGGGGADFGSSGGGGIGGVQNGTGDGAGGGNTGSGAFGGGGSGSVVSGAGGFGGGAGGALSMNGASGTFAGSGGPIPPNGGGQGGAGLGGAIFMRNGALSLTNAVFSDNISTGGTSRSGGSNGQGKGGALYISSTASASISTGLPAFINNSATNAGTGTACNTVVGPTALDTNDVCGILVGPATHFSLTTPSTAQSYVAFYVTVTALDANSNVATGYTGTVHLTSSDPGFGNSTGDITLVNGVGTFSVGMKQAGTQTVTATDTVNSSVTGTSSNITVTPGPATSLVVSAPANVSLGTPFSFTVTAKDLYGNTVTNFVGVVAFISTSPTATLPSPYPFTPVDEGTHTFSATANASGSFTIAALGPAITGVSGNIAVPVSPTVTKSFSPSTVEVGGSSTLTITLTNSNATTLNNVVISDTMPSGLTLETEQVGTTCGSIATGSGSSTIFAPPTYTATAARLTAGQSCAIVLKVKGTTTGAKVNTTSAVTSTEAGIGGTGTATLTVIPDVPPTISQSFTPATVAAGSTSQLSFTLTNPNTTAPLTGVGFADSLPAGLVVATPSGLTGSCGSGTIIAASTSISLVGATLAAGTSCTFSVNVQPSSVGIKVNTTSAVTSTEGGTGLTATATLTVTAGPATHFTVAAPATATAGTTLSFTVTALDQFNNTATGYTGTVHFTSTDGSSVLPANATLTEGAGTFNATLKTAGTQTIVATDTGNGTITGTSNTISVTASTATHFSVSAPATVAAGTAFNFIVTAIDAFNNTATGYAGTVHFTSTDGTATLPANSTLTNGVGTFSSTLKTAGTRTITATDAGNGAITGASNAISVTASPATHFSVSAPTTVAAGTALTFTVTAIDAFNNTATGYTGAVHFTSTDGSAVLPANTTLTEGIGTFSATLKTSGAQTIAATDTGNGTITGASNAISVTASAATHFSLSAPVTVMAGTAFNFTITALDQFNNTATNYAGTVHFTSTDGTATLPANSMLTNGAGTFSATLRTSGGQALSAIDTGNASVTGASNPIAVSSAAALRFVVSAPPTAIAGTAFNFTVTALDVFNNVASGYAGPVHFTSTDSQAVLPADSTLTGGTGTFSATLKTMGARTITAADVSVTSIGGTSGAIAVSTAPASSISATTGSGQSAQVHTAFATPLTIIVTDPFGNPIPEVTVTFTAPSDGPSATFLGAGPEATATAVTNAQGTAVVTAIANGIPGTFTITAAAAGQTASFTLTNTNPPPLNPHVDPSALPLSYTLGAVPTTATVNVTSDQPSTYSAVVTAPWLTVSPATGSTGQVVRAVSVAANGADLSPGLYRTNITFTFGDGSRIVVPVQLNVLGAQEFTPDTGALSFTSQTGTTAVQTQSFVMRSAGANFAATLAVTDVSGNGGEWLAVTPASFTTPTRIQVQVNPTGLAAGVYQKNIVFTGDASNSPYTLPVTLTVTPAAPVITVSSVVNGASFTSGPAAPNTIVTAFGTFPGCVANAQATVDGTAVDVFYSSATQISLLMPGTVAGKTAAQVQISCAGLTAAPVSVPIVATGPALFTAAQNGTGQVDVVNQDSSINTPSPAGTVIQLYGTGFGTLNPPGEDGLMHLAGAVTATVGGIDAQVLYAGQAPGYTLGLQQIDILVPSSVASGATLPLQLTIGGVTTQTALTLAIK